MEFIGIHEYGGQVYTLRLGVFQRNIRAYCLFTLLLIPFHLFLSNRITLSLSSPFPQLAQFLHHTLIFLSQQLHLALSRMVLLHHLISLSCHLFQFHFELLLPVGYIAVQQVVELLVEFSGLFALELFNGDLFGAGFSMETDYLLVKFVDVILFTEVFCVDFVELVFEVLYL